MMIEYSQWPGTGSVVLMSGCLLQDVEVVYYSEDLYNKMKVLAGARKSLKQRGIVGLHQASCLRALLKRLPLLLQEQYSHEKVGWFSLFSKWLLLANVVNPVKLDMSELECQVILPIGTILIQEILQKLGQKICMNLSAVERRLTLTMHAV